MRRCTQLLFALTALSSLSHAFQSCSALPDSKKAALADFVRKQYGIKDGTNLSVLDDKVVNDSCYRAVTFQGKSTVKTWELTLYLTPDQRFLIGDLFDTSLDPIAAQRHKTEVLMAGLEANRGSSRGPEDAPVTIVEFSDFECPYCKLFEGTLRQLDPAELKDVRIVFHHFPLSMHPWARAAAEGAACAQLQSAEAFWAVHDQIFQHQSEITTDNVKKKVAEYARSVNSLDAKAFQSCLDGEMSLGLVFRDMNLASTNQITGTPTIFINGRRVEGVRDATQLRQLIEQAKTAKSTTEPSSTFAEKKAR